MADGGSLHLLIYNYRFCKCECKESMPVLGVGECHTRMSSDMDQFSQVEEHPVDGQCIGNVRLYINTECISDSSHIIASQYCSVSHHLLARAWIHEIHACLSNQFLPLIIAIILLMNLDINWRYVLAICIVMFSMWESPASGSQMALFLAPLSIVASNRHQKVLVWIFFATVIRTTQIQSDRCKKNHPKSLTSANGGSCGPTEGQKVIQAMYIMQIKCLGRVLLNQCEAWSGRSKIREKSKYVGVWIDLSTLASGTCLKHLMLALLRHSLDILSFHAIWLSAARPVYRWGERRRWFELAGLIACSTYTCTACTTWPYWPQQIGQRIQTVSSERLSVNVLSWKPQMDRVDRTESEAEEEGAGPFTQANLA